MNQSATAADLSGIMVEALSTGLFSSLVTIQAPDGVFGASGAPSGTYANVAGLVDIRCMAAPLALLGGEIRDSEMKITPEILTKHPLHCLLEDCFPQITTKHRAILDGVAYDIAGNEQDSQSQMSRLLLTKNKL